jgi:hypothetical protein
MVTVFCVISCSASGDYLFGARIAVVGSLLSIILTFFMPDGDSVPAKPQETETPTNSRESLWTIVRLTWLFLLTKVSTSVANALAQAVFPLVLKNDFSLAEKGLGLSMSLMSAINAVFNSLCLGPTVRALGNDLRRVVLVSLLMTIVLYVAQGYLAIPSVTPSLSQIVYVTLPGDLSFSVPTRLILFLFTSITLSILQHLLALTLTSEASARVQAQSKGSLLGLEHSLFAAARVATPQIGVSLWQAQGLSAVSLACAAVFGVVSVVWKLFRPAFDNNSEVDAVDTGKKDSDSNNNREKKVN